MCIEMTSLVFAMLYKDDNFPDMIAGVLDRQALLISVLDEINVWLARLTGYQPCIVNSVRE